jgi:two-component system, LuxR family, response regulator FixJ
MPDTATTVYLIDDHEAFRQSTAWLLEAEDFQVNAFNDAVSFLSYLDQTGVASLDDRACIVSDIRMPSMSGMELLAEAKKRSVQVPILLITGHGDVALAVEAMKKGAANFIEKPFSNQAIVEAIHLALDEANAAKALLSAHAATQNLATAGAAKSDTLSPEAQTRLDRLSMRERQILDAVLEGKTNKMMARALDISIKTVELHRAKMMSKLGAKNAAELFHAVLDR